MKTNTNETPTPKDAKKKGVLKGWMRDLLLIALLVFAVGAWQARTLLPTGTPLPFDELELYDGGRMAVEELKGKPTLIVLWAPWCGVCAAEADNVVRVGRWLGGRANVVTMALDYQTLESVGQFIDKHDVQSPVMLGDRELAESLGVRAYPSLYVLNKEGKIKHRATGYTTTLGMLWRALF